MSSSSSPTSSSSSLSEPTRVKRKREIEHIIDPSPNASDYESDSQSDVSSDIDKPVEEDDTTVLSRAAKRRQTKKACRQQDDVESRMPKKKRKLKDGSAASLPKDATSDKGLKRQNSIWVGNLSFKTTEGNLKAFFKDRGVGDITRVNMPTKASKGRGPKAENRGFAYVDFDTPEAKQAAIVLSEQPLFGRKLLIKDGEDYSGRPNQPAVETFVAVNGVKKSLSKSAQKILRNQTRTPVPTLFFGNLSFDTTEASIRGLLEAHHEKEKRRGKLREEGLKEGEGPWIRKIRLGTFEDSGKCKGFAFVDFSTTDFATSALINPKNHHLNGRDLIVEYASPEAVRRGARKIQNQKSQGDTGTPTERNEKKFRVKKDLPSRKPKIDDEREDVMGPNAPEDDITPTSFGEPSHPQMDRQHNRERGRSRSRPKPGAALALAKRQSAAIVPSQGQKITF